MTMKVLIVDDTSSWIEFHKSCLNKIKSDFFEIETSNSAFDALELIKKNKYDLIISDLQMENIFEPEYAGEWLLRNTKNTRNSFTPAIFVSGSYNIKFIAEKSGVAYIQKQLVVNDLLFYK